MEELTLQELFYKATSCTLDIESLIVEADTKEKQQELLKNLVWMIPDGAAPDAIDSECLATDTESIRVQFINKLVENLSLLEEGLSEVFVDFNEDGDVDAYDAVTVDDSTDSTDSGSTGSDE